MPRQPFFKGIRERLCESSKRPQLRHRQKTKKTALPHLHKGPRFWKLAYGFTDSSGSLLGSSWCPNEAVCHTGHVLLFPDLPAVLEKGAVSKSVAASAPHNGLSRSSVCLGLIFVRMGLALGWPPCYQIPVQQGVCCVLRVSRYRTSR